MRRLQAEARQLAKDHIHAFTAAISEAERMAAEIAGGGDAYPAGVRDLARRFAEDAEARVQTLEAITARACGVAHFVEEASEPKATEVEFCSAIRAKLKVVRS